MSGYHHGNLRAALIEAAVDIARESGPEGVALREVARRTGVSHNAAYRHFADRDDLLGEVASVALQALADAMTRRIRRVRGEDPQVRVWKKLQAVGRAYVEYALTERGLFAAAFVRGAHPGPRRAGPFEILGAVLDECVAVGGLSEERRFGADQTCWSAVHGFAMLHLNGPLASTSKRARAQLLDIVLAQVADGIMGAPPGR